jgi:three-Cys-motif partner protein
MAKPPKPVDTVGPWTEVKVEIVQEYATVFQTIIKAQPYFVPIYIDGFAGAGVLDAERGKIDGTPARIVRIKPPFTEYHFIEKMPAKAAILRSIVGADPRVRIHEGDSNEILMTTILPTMTYESYRKGLLFLDPYKLQLDWRVVEAAGKTRCVDLLINFPVMDMNRTALLKDRGKVQQAQVERMNRFFPNDSWKAAVYEEEVGLFGPMGSRKKHGNDAIVELYRQQLIEIAGFKYVSDPLPMTNSKSAAVYYLIGASQKPQARSVFNGVFTKWRRKGVSVPPELDRVD